MDYGSGHRLTIPQPLSMHGLAPPSGGGGSTLPISSMRDPNVNNKRSRIGIPSSHSRSPSDDLPPPGSGPGPYSYHPGQNSTPFNRPSNSPYQHHPSQHHASQHHASQQHHQHHHQGQQQQQHHSNQQYQPFFSQAVSSHASPPPSFIPLQSDFSRSSGPSPRSGGAGSGGGPGFGLPTRTNSSSSSYETGLYSNMIRGPSGTSQSSGPAGGGGSSAAGGGDLFAAFLDADEQTRHQSQSSQSSNFALDWPVHSSAGGGGGNAGGGPGGGGSSATSVPSTSSSSGGF